MISKPNNTSLILLVLGTALPVSIRADDQPAPGARKGDQETAFFEAKIRPVLAKHCYRCHSARASSPKSGLLLDTRDGIRRGGDRGPAIVPGDTKKSVLLTAISHADPDLQMPPGGKKLPPSVISDFERWIRSGAPDPRVAQSAPRETPPSDLEAGRRFWAFQKTVRSPLPDIGKSDWPRRDLDRFILHRLQREQLAPSSDAPPERLLRRLFFDLIGLPPSRDQRREFLRQVEERGLDAALESQVDALLATDQYGERWGRHWLDVARFAESSGKETNVTYPHAWRYRNYVIDSFNDDTPFDQFLIEQIAGDLLPFENDEQRAEQLIATGFLAVGPRGLNEMNPFQFLADVADEQIDTVTRAVMASSVACARCHDHKFDPFSMKDYYALAGIFVSTKTYIGTSVAPGNQVGGDLLHLPEMEGQLIPNKGMSQKQVDRLKKQLADLQQEKKDRQANARRAVAEGKDPREFFSLQDALRILWRSGGIEGRLKTVDDEGNALALCMGVSDREKIIDAPLLERGEIGSPGERIARGFPEVIHLADLPVVQADQSGRLELARWLTHPEHPLTARVLVNRIWRHLMGAGIVRTVDNFGFNGERPSHPQLLDHLALKLVRNGWSVKSIVREIALSRTYRQSSDFRRECFQKDPENRFLWRASKRRLDAEAIRDSMLVVAGNIDLARPRGSLIANIGDKPVAIFGFIKQVPADLDGSLNRSVYLPVIRDRLPDVLDLFDFAEPSLVTGDRETTNVPLQALYLMNSEFVQRQASVLADRVMSETDDPAEYAARAFELSFARSADESELKLATKFFEADNVDLRDREQAGPSLARYCQALLATAEFRNLD